MTTELFALARDTIEGVVTGLGYPGIALLMLVETLVPPLPSELVLPFAGFLTSTGRLTVIGVLIASTAGSVAGALLLYGASARLGHARLLRLTARHGSWIGVRPLDLERILRTFRRRGGTIVFWARLAPAIRSLVSVPAGLARLDLARFVLYTTLGSLAWNGVLLGAGHMLGANWTRILGIVDRYEHVLFAIAALVGGYVLVRAGMSATRSLAGRRRLRQIRAIRISRRATRGAHAGVVAAAPSGVPSVGAAWAAGASRGTLRAEDPSVAVGSTPCRSQDPSIPLAIVDPLAPSPLALSERARSEGGTPGLRDDGTMTGG